MAAFVPNEISLRCISGIYESNKDKMCSSVGNAYLHEFDRFRWPRDGKTRSSDAADLGPGLGEPTCQRCAERCAVFLLNVCSRYKTHREAGRKKETGR